LNISNKEIRKLTLLSQELKLCHLAVLMNRNRKEHQEKKMVEEIEEEVEDMMIKMETTEEEVAEEATKVVVEAVDAATEIEMKEETEVMEEIKEEETMTEMEEEVVNGMEETINLEATVEVGMAEAEEVQVGTKAQATTTLTRKLIIEIPTTMILLMAVTLLTQVINFQLLQPLLTLKIIVLKGITTLNPKINTNNLLDHHRLTLLFI
jgi:hypothetical protein